jgi:outer membrane protein assembly factor BamB
MTQSRIGLRVLSCVVLTLAASLFSGSAYAKEPTPKAGAALSTPLAVRWKFTGLQFSNNPASPVLDNDTLYLATGTRIYALNASTGAQKWRYPTDTTLTSPILSTPAVAEGTIYFGTGDGLYALDAATGKQRWPHYNSKSGVFTTPVISGKTVYFGGGDQKIYALNAATGDPDLTVWSTGKRAGRDIGGDFAGNIVANNDSFFFVTGDQALRSVSIASGTLRWAQRLNATAASITPVLDGENIFAAVGEKIVGFRTSNGQSRFSFGLGNEALTAPAIDKEGNIYAINGDRLVVSISPRGRPNWKQLPQLEHEPIAAPMVKDGLLFIGTVLGGIYAIDTATGAVKWHYVVQPTALDHERIPTTTNVSAKMIANGSILYAPTDDGAVTAFEATSKSVDNMPPIVTVQEPLQGDYLSGRPPFAISAKVVDEGSGIMPSSVQLLLDGQPVARRSARSFDKPGFSFNGDTGVLEYTILDNDSGQRTTLADGHHKLTIVAKDWLGNTVNKTWSFYVDDTIRPKAKKKNNTNNPLGTTGGGGGKGGGGGGGGGNN